MAGPTSLTSMFSKDGEVKPPHGRLISSALPPCALLSVPPVTVVHANYGVSNARSRAASHSQFYNDNVIITHSGYRHCTRVIP